MLINFVISPELVGSEQDFGPTVRDVLLTALTNYGCLAGKRSDWATIIKSLPTAEKVKWTEMAKGSPSRFVNTDFEWAGLEDLTFPQSEDSAVVVSSNVASNWWVDLGLEVAQGETAFVADQVEVVPGAFVARSQVIDARNRWCNERIAARTSRDVVWSTRLRPVIKSANTLTIVDRYFLSDAANSVIGRGGGGSFWLMEEIAKACHNDPIALCLYSAMTEVLGFEDDLMELGNRLKSAGGDGVFELKIHAADERVFAGIEHDRYWRAFTGSRKATFTFSNSISIFENPEFSKAFQLSYKVELGSHTDANTTSDEERRLENSSRTQIF